MGKRKEVKDRRERKEKKPSNRVEREESPSGHEKKGNEEGLQDQAQVGLINCDSHLRPKKCKIHIKTVQTFIKTRCILKISHVRASEDNCKSSISISFSFVEISI